VFIYLPAANIAVVAVGQIFYLKNLVLNMRKLFAAVCICVIALSFTSCSHNNSVLPTTANPTNTTGQPVGGSWKVILFTDRGADETDDFSNYTFTFSDNGVFTATRSNLTVTGTWSRMTDDGMQKLVISISSGTDPHLAELNEDWVISLMTASNINLADDSGHHELKFQK